MIKKKLIIILFLLWFSVSVFGSEKNKADDELMYKKFSEKVFALYKSKKYIEGASLIEKNFDKFPDKIDKMAFNTIIFYIKARKPDKAIKILEDVLKKGVFYSKYILNGKYFKSFKNSDIFKKILIKNEQNRQIVQKLSKAKYEVVLPEKYDNKKKYPLFIALHGGMSNIKNFKPRWTSALLKQKFITLYIQSSQVISMDEGYEWGDLKITEKDIISQYKDFKYKYKIDENNILIGGFSSGGYGSLYSAFKQIIPIKGYVALCPVIPDEITILDIKKMEKIGLVGVIITSDIDPRIKSQKGFFKLVKQEGLRTRLITTAKTGHWFPKDLDIKIDLSIKYIIPTLKDS